MSVLVSERKESRFEVIIFADELRRMLVELMQRNFGIKDVERMVRAQYARGKMKTEDISYYISVLHCSKRKILDYANLLTANLRAANTIYPKYASEFERRRSYQNSALVNCEQILHELQHIVTMFHVDLNVYGRYIKAIDREIGLIKKWRQSDHKLFSRLA